MNNIQSFINDTKHRPWEKPQTKWLYYQEWNDALFLHFEVDYDSLRKLVPEELTIDNFNNTYYISIVAFKMEKIRPRNLPSVSFISDFYEINVRTYVEYQNKNGVCFLNIEAEKWLSAFIARKLSGLPYEKSNIIKNEKGYFNENPKKKFKLKAEYKIKNKIHDKGNFDKWLTERYCLYLQNNNLMYRYEIHHKEWDLFNLEFGNLSLTYKFNDMELTENNVSAYHYSPGVRVTAWGKEQL